jgi:acyl carrier protein
VLPGHDEKEYAVLNIRRPSSTPFRVNLQRAFLNKGRFILVDISEVSPSEMDRLLTGRVVLELTVTPTMVRTLFPHFQGDWLTSVQRIHVNGERVYRDDLESIFLKMPDVTVRLNYGLTETGNVAEGFLTVKDLSFVVDPVSVGVPTKDVEIREHDADDETTVGEIGRVFVRGAQGFEGSFNDVGHFTFERFHLDGWQETGDRGFFNDRNELVILGRTQETLKIRGSRLSILEIEDIIRDTGMVSAVLVAVYQDARGNDSLGALVVPVEGEEFTLAELRRRITERYSLVMCPTRSIIVHEVPVLVAGKVDRVTATKMLNESHSEITAKKSNSTLNVVRDIILKVLPVQSLGFDEDIFEAGMDSLASLEVLDQLSDAFGMILDVRVLLENPTVASLAGALLNYVQPQNRLSRLSSARTSEKATIYWILPGANPFMAQKLAVSISGVHHIAVLNLGAMNGEVVLPDAESMISCLVNAIVADRDPTVDIFVAGFSSAGLIASEVARVLFDSHGIGRGVILIDPLDSQVLVPQTPARGRVNPFHVMLGREGRLAALDPVQMDHALLGVQLYALSQLKLQPISIPTLHLARNQTMQQKSLWGSHSLSQYFMCDIPHLDFVRRPQHCAPFINEFVHKILAES